MSNLHRAWDMEQVPNGPVQFGAMGVMQQLARKLHPRASRHSFARLSRALIRRQLCTNH